MNSLNKIYKIVALKLGLNINEVKEAYQLYWNFFRKHIETLPLKSDLSEEEFNKLRTSFNVPSIGKFSCTYKRYIKIKQKQKIKEDAKNN